MVDSSEPKLSSFSPDEPQKLSKPSSADMLFYYERILPFRHIFQWLNHLPKPSKDFTMREFAYEFRSGAYQRYNSFSSPEEFKKLVVAANPTRFEVGAVYAVNPKERRNLPKSAMKPLSKELVFDIDLTDYDSIRTCCSGTDICKKCWKFIQVASRVISQALKEDFGFDHFIWVFSGRRGAHCWVSDARARSLDEATRKSIVEYLDVLGGRTYKGGKTSLSLKKPYHPHIERSLELLRTHFEEVVLEDQNPWATSGSSDEETWTKVDELLSFIPDPLHRAALKSKWKDSTGYSSSRAKWDDINAVAQKVLKHQSQVSQLNDAKKEIIMYYMYPRLDIEVSKQLIHLLKSPFCIHPGTGNVCVPFDPTRNISGRSSDDEYGFNPMNAPNLSKLQDEIEIYDAKRISRGSSQPSLDTENNDAESSRVADYEKTSLKPYIQYFSSFVNNLLKNELKTSKRDRDEDPLEF